MGANSSIQWTDHTFNPWIGCTKVSPGCDHCYAESYANRYGKAMWGPGQARQLTSDANWKKPLKWNHEAMLTGIRPRVFCASLADVFDNEVDPAWRIRLFDLIKKTPYLDWLLLTKRIGNVPKMLPRDWESGWPNVWLGISVVNQEEADRDIPKLLAAPARIRFLSMEPLLGPVDLSRFMWPVHWSWAAEFKTPKEAIAAGAYAEQKRQALVSALAQFVGWVIVGGESGSGARPMHPDWARSLRDQCQAAGVAFHFKQWGEWASVAEVGFGGRERQASVAIPGGEMIRVGKKVAGRMLDGREWNELPSMAA